MSRHRLPEAPVAAELRARLRAADPLRAEAVDAAGEELALGSLAARIEAASALAATARPERRFAFGAPLLALATIVAVAWLGVRFAERPRTPAPSAAAATAAPDAPSPALAGAESRAGGAQRPGSGGDEAESRQIQFETAGGTRVIWVLDPRFTL